VKNGNPGTPEKHSEAEWVQISVDRHSPRVCSVSLNLPPRLPPGDTPGPVTCPSCPLKAPAVRAWTPCPSSPSTKKIKKENENKSAIKFWNDSGKKNMSCQNYAQAFHKSAAKRQRNFRIFQINILRQWFEAGMRAGITLVPHNGAKEWPNARC
jgi:hypothetical protein